jgi:hypothetical protein
MIIFFLLGIYLDNSVKLPVGIKSTGLGGLVTLVDEGLSVFHNPAINSHTRFNFTLSRWVYNTNLLACGIEYKRSAIGLHYLNYGTIQGYDDYGIPTSKFAPYDLNIGIAKSFGPLGVCLKNFQTHIDSVFYFGITGGAGSYFNFHRIGVGFKIDDIGKELARDVEIPFLIALGIEFLIGEDFEFFMEVKGKEFILSSGFQYRYENLKIFAGIKYLKPSGYVKGLSLSDCHLSGGFVILFDEYELGYSFVYTEYSIAHQIGIVFNP